MSTFVTACCATVFVVTSSLAPHSAFAQQDFGRIEIHGAGWWQYGRTGGPNQFQNGIPGGNYGRSDIDLNLSAMLNPNLRIVVQPGWQSDGLGDVRQPDIGLAFVEWTFSDALKLRAGQAKHPFGIYSEIFSVGTLRPFLSLPEAVYGAAGLAAESYSGIGLTGSRYTSNGWAFDYDLYGGGLSLNEQASPIGFAIAGPDSAEETAVEATKNVIGGRIVIAPPIAGLRLGGSFYRGTLQDSAASSRWVAGAQAQYSRGRLTARSELVQERAVEPLGYHATVSSGYVQAGYQATDAWQVVGLYDRLNTSIEGRDVLPGRSSFLRHAEVAVGLDYWATPTMVLKASFHVIDGNRFAAPSPSTLSAVFAAGGVRPTTRAVFLGTQVSF